ncbi:MAG: exodeoxyribonuclease V subunit gamma, partial [Actinomycetota bacterium]|nr:exodeoxyribonuclease V subunit gamma [Actinomycetota bacterium]
QSTLDAVLAEVEPLVSRTAAMLVAPRRSVDVSVSLGGGRELRGTVAGIHGTTLVSIGYSKMGPKQQLSAWIGLLALACAHPERPWTAVAVGRRDPGRPTSASFGPLDEKQARTHLIDLVDLYDRGMREPLPLFCQTSAAYAQAAHGGQDAELAGRRAWESEWNFDHEDRELEHQLVLGGELPFSRVLGLAPQAGEDGPDWRHDELTRFGRLARRLWDGLLACEQVSAR